MQYCMICWILSQQFAEFCYFRTSYDQGAPRRSLLLLLFPSQLLISLYLSPHFLQLKFSVHYLLIKLSYALLLWVLHFLQEFENEHHLIYD